MVHFKFTLGEKCDLATARRLYEFECNQYITLLASYDNLAKESSAKDDEIRRLKEEIRRLEAKNKKDNDGWWNLLRSFSKIGPITFIDGNAQK